MWKLISFYTIGTPYASLSRPFISKLEQLKIPHEVEGVKNQGTWVANCAMKPSFCLSKMNDGNDVVWVDIDAHIQSYPVLFDTLSQSKEHDIAYHFFRKKEVTSGTLWLKNCPAVKELLQLWISELQKTPREWDQRVLQRILENQKISTFYLPEEYCTIDKLHSGVQHPVIYHTQASRSYRRKV